MAGRGALGLVRRAWCAGRGAEAEARGACGVQVGASVSLHTCTSEPGELGAAVTPELLRQSLDGIARDAQQL